MHALAPGRKPLRLPRAHFQVSFHKRATNYRALLREMTYNNKAFYGSSPPCTVSFILEGLERDSSIWRIPPQCPKDCKDQRPENTTKLELETRIITQLDIFRGNRYSERKKEESIFEIGVIRCCMISVLCERKRVSGINVKKNAG